MNDNFTPVNQTKRTKSKFSIIFLVLIIMLAFLSGIYLGVWQSYRTFSQTPISDLISNHINLPFSDKVDTSLFNKVWQSISEKYINGPIDEKTAYYGALQGLVKSLGDPYSVFFDPSQTVDFNQELSGNFEGIGAEIGIKNNQLTIIASLSHTPAEAAGLKAGDKIIRIDGRDTAEMSLDQAISLIRGEKGTVVTLNIFPAGQNEIKEIKITREVIKVKSVNWQMKDGNIAWVGISHFNSDTDEEFNKIVQEIVVKNPKGIILDLRNNPGGFLETAVYIAGVFLDKKVIVIEDFGTKKNEYRSTNNSPFKDIKTVVLVNLGSASASEIIAGALQDYQKAVIVGQKTFGKGSVQNFEEFADGSSLKLTVAKWLTPNGRSIDDSGITPDVEVAMTDDDYNNDKDPQLDKALELLK